MNLSLSDIVYTPLDLPKLIVDRDVICNYYDERKTVADNDFLEKVNYPWWVVHIRPDWIKPKKNEIHGSGWDEDFRTLFPNVVDVVESLPFSFINRVYLLEQLKEVPPHKDISKETDPTLGPSTFRCPIVHEDPENTFYFIRDGHDEELYPRLPDETNWFSMSNYTAKHGSHIPSQGKRKLMMCVWGKVDVEKYKNLINRSVNRYSEYVIYT
ncbi:MAG: hypothetical protein WC284_10175 [Candidimonas sp.]